MRQSSGQFVTVWPVEFNLARIIATIAEKQPDRVALMHRGNEIKFPTFVERFRRLGGAFESAGYGCRVERLNLQGHESGQDHIALYLNNGPEYLEAMLGAWSARAATFNVNHRYVS